MARKRTSTLNFNKGSWKDIVREAKAPAKQKKETMESGQSR